MIKNSVKVNLCAVRGVVVIGWGSNNVYSIYLGNKEVVSTINIPKSQYNTKIDNTNKNNKEIDEEFSEKISTLSVDSEKNSPSDHITEEQIHVYKSKITIDINDASWARFTPTGSMVPVIDENANSIELKPKTTEDIKVGDIVSYKSDYADGIIIHRIVEISYDDNGWYARLKGDSLNEPDPGKIRFNQIEGVVVGIIY